MIAYLVATLMAGTPLYEQSETELGTYITALNAGEKSFDARLWRVIQDSLGTPYHDGPLGEGPNGVYDADPLVDFARADCVTYVEQAVAAAAGTDYDDMLGLLQRIRYKDGRVDYETRNHFLITDWTRNNPFCVDVTCELGAPTKASIRVISRKGFFERVKAPGLGADTADESVRLEYIPCDAVDAAEPEIPSPALIVFIGKVDWLFALHCGLYARDASGAGLLYHASSKAGKVVGMPLSEYVSEQSGRYLGFTVYKINDPKE